MKIEKIEEALKLIRSDNLDEFKKVFNDLDEQGKIYIRELGTRHKGLGEVLIKIKQLNK